MLAREGTRKELMEPVPLLGQTLQVACFRFGNKGAMSCPKAAHVSRISRWTEVLYFDPPNDCCTLTLLTDLMEVEEGITSI
jgi:hypothetical protein